MAQLAERFNVTLETIRSDLKYLENEGLIKRCHGGAILGKQEIKRSVNLVIVLISHAYYTIY